MKETFQTHHIDGNHDNNEKKNKVKLCASCHAITFAKVSQARAKELFEVRHGRKGSEAKVRAWRRKRSAGEDWSPGKIRSRAG